MSKMFSIFVTTAIAVAFVTRTDTAAAFVVVSPASFKNRHHDASSSSSSNKKHDRLWVENKQIGGGGGSFLETPSTESVGFDEAVEADDRFIADEFEFDNSDDAEDGSFATSRATKKRQRSTSPSTIDNESNDDSSTNAHQHCVDSIALDLNGDPLTAEYLAAKMNVASDDDADNDSYTYIESDDFRGLMSNACRLRLLPSNVTAFYKRIVFMDHPHATKKVKTAPYKLVTDIQSYKNVNAFLTSQACRTFRETTGILIPKCYDSQLAPNDDNPIESKFSFLLEDLPPSDGWYQRWLLKDAEECQTALSTLAKFHAFFWNGSSFWKEDNAAAGRELEEGMWPSGGYVQPNRNRNQCQNVAQGWNTNRQKWKQELAHQDYWENLGERLQSTAEENGRHAHPFAEEVTTSSSFSKSYYQNYRTLVHGDPKQANFLFRRTTTKSTSTTAETADLLEVGLIDFQWSGFGLAASDVAHFMTSAVHADRLVDGGEERLLRYYFHELQKYLVEYGAFRDADDALHNYSYDTFQNQYETGVLDICRLVIAYAWSRFDPVDENDQEAAAYARTMNKNSYNKSKPSVIWLMSRCDEIMKSRGY